MRKGMTRRLTIAASIVGLGAIAASIAYATIPDTGGVIRSCYDKDNGNVRLIDPASPVKDRNSCRTNERALNWNMQGLKGDSGTNGTNGTNGTDGVDGSDGAPGTDGISGYAIVSEHFVFGEGTVLCTDGKHVIGGGAEMDASTGTLSASGPHGSIGWHALGKVLNDPGGLLSHGIQIMAICATTP
jgi:hypothetical protein